MLFFETPLRPGKPRLTGTHGLAHAGPEAFTHNAGVLVEFVQSEDVFGVLLGEDRTDHLLDCRNGLIHDGEVNVDGAVTA
jgi:hypothetical protein